MKDQKLRAALRYREGDGLAYRVEDLRDEFKALRDAFNDLFDFLAEELGFEGEGVSTGWGGEMLHSPRRLKRLPCPPTVARTIPRRARKAGGAK